MNPQELAQLLASGDKEKVKQAQKQLQALGYDIGPTGADGGLGDATSKAMAQYRTDFANNQTTELGIAEANREANDPVKNAIRGATEVLPYVGGAAVGAGVGHKVAKDFKASDKALGEEVKRLAKSPKVSGTVAEKQLGSLGRRRAASTLSQFLGPGVLLGSAEYINRGIAPQFEDEETRKWIELGANADRGAGLGLLAHQLVDLRNRFKNPADAEDVGSIRTRAEVERAPQGPSARAMERGPLSQALSGQTIDAEALPEPRKALPAPPSAPSAPQGPAAPAPGTNPYNPGTAKYMAWQLKNDFGVKGAWGMNKSQLSEALSKVVQEHGTKRTVGKKVMDAAKKGGGKAAIPLAVGAYMAGAGDSEAADGSMASRAGDAAVNFGTGAGAAYGGIKLSDLLTKAAPTAMRSLGGGAAMAMPGEMVSAMTDYPQEDLNMGRNWLARNLPEGMQFGAVDEAREMATVPPRSPANAGPRVQQEEPASGGFSPNVQGRLQRMISMGADPQQIASFLNQAAAR